MREEDGEYRPTIKELPAADRPRERLLLVGPQALNTAELLAIVLRTGIGGENAVRLAERLLAAYDGLGGLAQAGVNQLLQEKGLGEAKVAQIKAALELGRRLMLAGNDVRPQVSSPQDAANLVMGEMAFLEQEHLRAILLDTRHRVLEIVTVSVGGLNTAGVRMGDMFREAVRSNASALIAVHNHPSGDPTPSVQDVTITRKMVEAGKLLGVKVLDHLVIGRGRWVSLKERNLGF
jgi:DNA repair protein RadC